MKICNLELEVLLNRIDQTSPLYLSVGSILDGMVDLDMLQCHNDAQCHNNRTSFSTQIRTLKYQGEGEGEMDEGAEAQAQRR
jgi:hypothetical protein